LLVILKALLAKRPELKLVLMSATLKSSLFAAYFGSEGAPAPAIEIPGNSRLLCEFVHCYT